MRSSERIIITGADGFLGTELCRQLHERKIRHSAWAKMRIRLTDEPALLRHTRGAATIVHLAGNVRTPATDTAEQHMTVNALGTRNLLEAARKNRVRRFILASTVEVYSPTLAQGKVRETDLCAPTHFYGQSKLLAETYVQEYAQATGMQNVILRFGYLYGPGMHPSRIIPRLISNARTGTSPVLPVARGSFNDMLHVSDAAHAIVLALTAKNRKNMTLNIASGRKTTVADIIRAIQTQKPQFRPTVRKVGTMTPSWYYDINQAARLMRFVPAVRLREGIKDCINNDSKDA